MKDQYRFGSANDTALREAAQISGFISDLDRLVRILTIEIATEEEHARLSDPSDVAYPILARTYAARRANLTNTIAVLEKRLAILPDRTEPLALGAERPSRPKDVGYANLDAPPVDRIKELILSGRASSPSAAARLIHRRSSKRSRSLAV
jgi:hypothetical protein